VKKIIEMRRSLIREIVFTIFAVIISIPVWLNLDVDAIKEAQKYDNYNYVEYELLNKVDYNLEAVSDDYALRNLETEDLIVYNGSVLEEEYKVLFKISKNSTASIDNLKLSVNQKVNYLKDHESYEDADYYYYVIDADTIMGTAYKYSFSIWNDEDAIVASDDVLDYEIIVA
jgi:hypothetical protein